MSISIYEQGNSRGGTNKSLARKYFVEGTSDESEVIDAVLGYTPGRVGGLYLTGVSIQEVEDNLSLWEAVAQFGEPGGSENTTEDKVEYSFSFMAPSTQIYQSLATITYIGLSGAASTPTAAFTPDYKGAINVLQEGSARRVEGYNLAPPPETFKLAYYPANSFITSSYERLVENLCGKVNSVSYRGRPAGSLMLSHVSGGGTNGKLASIEFGFSYKENETSVAIGSLTVPSKDGMDLLWAVYEDVADSDAKVLVKQPLFAYVERIYRRADFSSLGLPA